MYAKQVLRNYSAVLFISLLLLKCQNLLICEEICLQKTVAYYILFIMKKFLEFLKLPVIVGGIAAILFCVDSLIAHYILEPAFEITSGFMWVAFVGWTITFGMKKFSERAQMLSGNVIGFIAAIAMLYFGKIFDLNIIGISIAAALGVFVVNIFAVSVGTIQKLQKYWSSTGIFMGMFLVFSGLGVNLWPNTFGDSFLILGIIMVYSTLGYICAMLTQLLTNKWKKKEQPTEITEVNPEEAQMK